jgi:hypothetical protein
MSYHPTIIKTETLLSSWIFCWAVIYCIAKYFATVAYFGPLNKFANPVFALLFAIVFQIYAFIKIILIVRPISNLPRILAKFFVVTFFVKLLPLYLVVGAPPLNEFAKIIFGEVTSGIPAFVVVFMAYFAYITQQNLNLFEIYDDLVESCINDDNRIPPYRWTKSAFNL